MDVECVLSEPVNQADQCAMGSLQGRQQRMQQWHEDCVDSREVAEGQQCAGPGGCLLMDVECVRLY